MITLAKKNLRIAIILLLWTVLLLEPAQLLADNEFANLQANNRPFHIENSGQADPCLPTTKYSLQAEINRINITVTVPLLQRFSLLSLNNWLTARILISVNVEQTALDSYSLEMPTANVINFPPIIQQEIYRLSQTTTRMRFVVPSEMKNFTLELSRSIPIWTIFYRSYVVLVPFTISSNIPVVISNELRVTLLPKSKFLSGYPSVEGLSNLAAFSDIEQDRMGQTIFRVKGFFNPIKVAWEPKYWERNALLIIGGIVAILVLLFLAPGQLKRRSRLQKLSAGSVKIVAIKNKIVKMIANRSTTNTHAKLLLTLSMIMVSIPLTVGEDPRTNILVLASIPVEKEIEQIAAQTSDMIEIYTVGSEYNDLPTISRLRFFDAVIIGDFALSTIPMSSPPPVVVQALDYIGRKIVLDQYKSITLVKWILETYKGVIVVRGQAELGLELNHFVARNKGLLGWDSYVRIIQIEALFSLLVTMLLVTTIVVYLMENNNENLHTNLARTITITIFAFSFLQSVFFTVSRLLIPLSTHAGGAGITAISYIGPFGGGSMPRMASAILGFVFAFASASKKHGKEFSTKLFVSLVATGLFLIVDPVTGSQFVWDFLLEATYQRVVLGLPVL